MSKSLGNGVDPMDVIDKYGADSLRYFLATGALLARICASAMKKWNRPGILPINLERLPFCINEYGWHDVR